MLYELIGIVRPGNLKEVKELARSAGTTILSHNGVIRSLTNRGTYLLPKPWHINQQIYRKGHHFVMTFDSSPTAQHAVRKVLGKDPRLLRFSVVKVGEKLQDICDVSGKEDWKGSSA